MAMTVVTMWRTNGQCCIVLDVRWDSSSNMMYNPGKKGKSRVNGLILRPQTRQRIKENDRILERENFEKKLRVLDSWLGNHEKSALTYQLSRKHADLKPENVNFEQRIQSPPLNYHIYCNYDKRVEHEIGFTMTGKQMKRVSRWKSTEFVYCNEGQVLQLQPDQHICANEK